MTGRVAVQQQHVADALALQGQADDQPALPGADDDDIEDMLPGSMGYRPDPRGVRMGERRHIPPGLHGEPSQIRSRGRTRPHREMRVAVGVGHTRHRADSLKEISGSHRTRRP